MSHVPPLAPALHASRHPAPSVRFIVADSLDEDQQEAPLPAAIRFPSSASHTRTRRRHQRAAVQDAKPLKRNQHSHTEPCESAELFRTTTRWYAGESTSVSVRQVRLHAFDRSYERSGAVETKIGGHALDHVRMIESTATWEYEHAQPMKLAPYPVLLAAPERTTMAFARRHQEPLEYACVKIGGHAMDHVPFIDRGLPSRPLLGYRPSRQWADFAASPPVPTLTAGPARGLGNVYDCSYCLRMRSSPRLQLCCGHPICTSCIVSRDQPSVVEYDSLCYVECRQCEDLVPVEAAVFPNNQRVPFFSAVGSRDTIASPHHKSRVNTAWEGAIKVSKWLTSGGIAVALVMRAGRLRPLCQVKSESKDPAVIHQTAYLSSDVGNERAEVSQVKDSDKVRWQRRVKGLRSPSKLLQYKFIRTLGKGNFAEVMLVENRKGAKRVLKESDKLQEAVNEIQILSKVHDNHVVRIYQFFSERVAHRQFVYIEMEYCDRGDLRQLLEQGPLSLTRFEDVFRQICAGLQVLYSMGVVHRDLKPGNILLTSDGFAKIADFGVSTILESNLQTTHAAGTLGFMAPEVRRFFLGEEVRYDTKADIWSLGALAVAMLTGRTEPRVSNRPLEDVMDELTMQGVPSRHSDLIKSMLSSSPAQRPTLAFLQSSFPIAAARL